MALVTETLLDLLRKQIRAHGTVVWYDAELAYLQELEQKKLQHIGLKFSLWVAAPCFWI